MAAVRIKNIVIGEGMPKICIPLTDKDTEGIRHSLNVMREAEFDVIEWRADKFAALGGLLKAKSDMCEAAGLIREVFPEKPLIFTVRTNRDMESFEISDEDYLLINKLAADMRLGDIIDIEYSRGEKLVKELTAYVHAAGMKTIVSRHIADSTPETDVMTDILTGMQKTGCDIVKLAVTPHSERDVLRLMDAILIMRERHSGTPVITMSMSRLGALSRISGALTGSCLSFGTVGAASAPGQLECGVLHEILEALG